MSHPLQQKLARVRGRLRRLVVVYGLSWLVGGVIAAVLVLGLADYLIRFEDRGLRVLATLAVLSTAGWFAYRYLLVAMLARWSDVQLAERLGREFPRVGDGLPSAVEFLGQPGDDPTAGSPTLRRAVIAHTTAECERLDFLRAIHPGPVVRAVFWTTAACLLALIFVVLDPAASRTAVARLVNPFGSAAWPQSTHLAIFEGDSPVQSIARGDPFEVELVGLGGTVSTAAARIRYRYRDAKGNASDETRIMRRKGSHLAAKRTNVTSPFSYSVEVDSEKGAKFAKASQPPVPAWFAVQVVDRPGGEDPSSEPNVPPAEAIPAEAIPVVRPVFAPGDEAGSSFHRLALLVRESRLERVVRGQSFQVRVVDAYGRTLPSHARIDYRFGDADGNITDQSETMHLLDGMLVARRDDVARAFSYRVSAGDDDSMPWIPVVVVEPPTVEELSATLFPPDYTGWPSRKADGTIQALVGTRVEVSARANRALDSATLRMETGEVIEASISGPQRREIQAEFVVARSGAYWFDLVDRDRLGGGAQTRWEIRAVSDESPTVSIREPATNLFVTPGAELPLRVAAKDDLSIRRIDLVLTRSDRPDVSEAVRPLYVRQAGVGLESLLLAGTHWGEGWGEDREVSDRWGLAELKLVPGMYVTFYATATDDQPNSGKSQPRRLDVITAEQLAQRSSGKQAYILAELARVLGVQRESRRQVAAAEIRLAEVGTLGRSDLDHLRGAELNQRQVNRTLTSPSDGLPMHVLGLLADLDNNHVDSPHARHRMQTILHELNRLAAEHLPVIGRELTAAIKAAQIALEENGSDELPVKKRAAERQPSDQPAADRQPPPPDPRLSMALATSGEHQDQVIDSLETLLGQLAQWDDYRRFEGQIGQLLRDQEELTQQTAELARRTLAEDLKDLAPPERANLKTASRRQYELARSLDRIQQAMQQASGRLADSDSAAGETVADALDRARELTASGRMQSSAEAIAANRLGLATAEQQQIAQDLREVLDILANRDQHDLAAEQFAKLQEVIAAIRERQRKAIDETRRLYDLRKNQGDRLALPETAAAADLARRQSTLVSETTRVAEKLVGADVFDLALTGAADEMDLAAGLLGRHEFGSPTQRAQRKALVRLDQLLQALEPDAPQDATEGDKPAAGAGGGDGQKEPPGEPADAIKILAQLKLLKILQEEVNQRTKELEATFGSPESRSKETVREYTQLSREQGRLADLLWGVIRGEELP